MKKLIALVVCVIIAIGCSRSTLQTDKEKLNLKGDVISTLTLSFEAIDKFGEGKVTKGNLNSFGSEYAVYDSLGNQLCIKEYFFKDIVKDWENNYDNSGFLIEEAFCDDKDNLIYRYKYINDSLGNKMMRIDEDNDKTIYHYDSNKRLIKESEKYWDILRKYDEKGRLVEFGIDWKDGKPINMSKYYYDDNNNIVKVESKNRYTIKKYDNKNHLIESVSYKIDNKIDVVESKYKYFYNKNGKLAKSITWDKDGKIEDETSLNYYYVDTTLISVIQMKPDDVVCYIVNNLYQENNNLKSKIGYKLDAEVSSMLKSYYVQNLLTSRRYSSEYLDFQEIYTYDKNRLEEMKLIIGDSATITNYDRKSRPILETEYDKNNKPIGTRKFEYSGSLKNCVIKQYSKNIISNEESSVISTYKMNKLVEEKSIKNGVELILRIDYNENGDIIKKENVSINEVESYEYKYDKKGNWIEQTIFKNNEPKIIKERIIRYFED